MNRGFYTIMAAQFCSSLADNALLIVAIQMLIDMHADAALKPLLKFSFTLSYVMLAPFVGAFADSMPKGRVMLIMNSIKILGCCLLFMAGHPTLALLAYAVVGFGAAAYSPAKYGILTELLPASKLVVANGWIEGTTVVSIILGTLLGGALVGPRMSQILLGIDIPRISTGIDTASEAAITVIGGIYCLAALFNFGIPDSGARYAHQPRNPFKLLTDFWHCNKVLWKDRLGQISLATTTLFWGAGATLQFIVLEWAASNLGLPLSSATQLQGIVAVGIAIGAIGAARLVRLEQAVKTLPLGLLMAFLIVLMTVINSAALAFPILALIGALAGFFVVPMNALLQHRGHVLMSAGHSIAVQNFNENVSILVMLAVYALLVKMGVGVNGAIVLFGLSVAAVMYLIRKRHQLNERARLEPVAPSHNSKIPG